MSHANGRPEPASIPGIVGKVRQGLEAAVKAIAETHRGILESGGDPDRIADAISAGLIPALSGIIAAVASANAFELVRMEIEAGRPAAELPGYIDGKIRQMAAATDELRRATTDPMMRAILARDCHAGTLTLTEIRKAITTPTIPTEPGP